MTGTRKCAIGLTALGTSYSSKILQQLPKDTAARLVAEITRMPNPSREESEAAVRELHEIITSGTPTALAGRDFADSLLNQAYGDEAAEMRNRMASTMAGKSFEFLEEMEPGQVAALLEPESEDLKALVLGHLDPVFRHTVMTLLPEAQQGPLVLAIGRISNPNPAAVSTVAKNLRDRAESAVLSREKAENIGGVHAVVDLINRSGASMEKRLLEGLDQDDPEMAAKVRDLMFTFADFVNVSDAAMEEILRGVNITVLAKALSGAKPELESKMLANMASLVRQDLEAEREGMKRVSRSEQEEARSELVQRARALESEEKITLRGEEDYV